MKLADEFKEQLGDRILSALKEFDPKAEAGTGMEEVWTWYARLDWQGKAVAVVFEIDEGSRYGEESGCNLCCIGTVEDGKMLFGLIPYNYTPQCWTNDLGELENRLEIVLENLRVIVDDLPNLAKEHLE